MQNETATQASIQKSPSRPDENVLWDLAAAQAGTERIPCYDKPVIVLSRPSDVADIYSALEKAARHAPSDTPPGRFFVRRDFDCGMWCNAWSSYVVRPSGQHIAELQFSIDDEPKAQAIADAMNKALDLERAALGQRAA